MGSFLKRYTLRPDSFLASLLRFLSYCRLPLLITLVLLLLLLFSQLVYTGVGYLFPRVRVVDWGTIEDGQWVDVLVLRSESVLTAPFSGEVCLLVEEGTRRGIVFVAPVGNRVEQEVLWFPASHRDVVAVAGTDRDGQPYPNALIASQADVCAPAANIFTAVPGQNHNFLQGTSMSSAIVSGLVALAHDKYGRIRAAQLPQFKGDLCQWEQKLLQLPLCDQGL